MKNQVTKKLLDRYLNGKCSSSEEKAVLQWLKSGSKEDFQNEIEGEWADFQHDSQEEDVDLPFEDLDITPNRRVINLPIWVKVAASFLLVITFSYLAYNFSTTQEEQLITRRFQNGTPSVLTLEDGSKVTLNAGSSISYPVKFASNRQVYLEGEAYFDISSGSQFTVHAGNVATKTLRSSFNVSAYPEDDEVVVSVLRGEAEVTNGEKTAPLIKLRIPETLPLTKLVPAVKIKGNEYLAYSKENNTVSKGIDFDTKEVSAWKEGTIYFNNADSAKVLKRLERWYGVNIEVSGCLGQKFFNGEFNNKSLDEIIMTISTNASAKLRYSREGDDVVINGACI